MPTLKTKFTTANMGKLDFETELAKVMKVRKPRKEGAQAAIPQALDFYETADKGRGASLILTLNRSGVKTWAVLVYDHGKPRRKRIGYFNHSAADYPRLSVEQARAKAAKIDANEVLRPKPGSFANEIDKWFDKVVKGKLRSESEISRHIKYAKAEWGTWNLLDIRRGHVVDLMDRIEAKSGARAADLTLATLRSFMRWYAARDRTGQFMVPIVPKMNRATPADRSRILDDSEIVELWKLEGQFADFCKIALLTGQRRDKIVTMRWSDIKQQGDDRIWEVRIEAREKGNIGAVKLPKLVMDILERQPRLAGNDYVWAVPKGEGHLNSWSDNKAEIDKQLPHFPAWVIHDLRRTARSLMSKLRIDGDVAEAVLGHKLGGVRKVYDRYERFNEKCAALESIAGYLSGLLDPKSNIVQMRKKAKRTKMVTRKALTMTTTRDHRSP